MSERPPRLVTTRRGIRIMQHGAVLSEVLSQPGPTHSVVDVMAAAVQSIDPGPEILMLGFEGGGLLAPLRAMGGTQAVTAVDISNRSFAVFKQLCQAWAGRVSLHLEDAEVWLRGAPDQFDFVVEDLCISSYADVHKPAMLWGDLPQLVQHRLRPTGAAIFNLLRPRQGSWKAAIAHVVAPFERAQLILLDEFENRLVVAGRHRLATPELARRLRQHLRRIASRQADRIQVRSLKGSSVGPN